MIQGWSRIEKTERTSGRGRIQNKPAPESILPQTGYERRELLSQERIGPYRWIAKGTWAVLDQALFSGSNFLVSLLLARWLEPTSYGAFSVAFSVLLLLGTLHTALWTEPMVVYGSGRFRETFGEYQRVLVHYHWRFGVLAGLTFAFASAGLWAGGQHEMALSLLGLASAAPLVLYLWLVRRGAYVFLEPRLAVYGGVSYLVLYLGAAWVLLKLSLLKEVTAFLSMGAAAFFAAEVVRFRLKVGATGAVEAGHVRSLHWGYGRWALLAGGLSWVPGNIYYLVLPAFHGLEAAAQLKALMNLLMPVLHFNGALGQLLVPGMVRARAMWSLGRFTKTSLAALLGFSVVYWVLLVGLGRNLMGWLYGEKYVHVSVWLPWLGFLPMLSAVVSVASSLLRALERPEAVAFVYALLAGLAATAGVALVWMHGVKGAVEALLLVNAVAAFAFWLAKGKG